jgi:hypothetical protein
VVLGEILGTLASAHDLEARRSCPVHHLAYDGGLVAVGQRVNHPGFLGAPCEEGSHQGVGLDVDHDHVATVAERQQRVADTRRWRTGGLHRHVNILHQGLGDDKYRPCPLLKRYVAAGRLGRKSGKGFYEYE